MDETEPLFKSQPNGRLRPSIVSVQVNYDSIEQVKLCQVVILKLLLTTALYWQVTVQLPGPGAPGARTVTTAADDDSDDHITNNTVTDPKSINTDAPAPNSYICLGYTFSIIAGFCFTSWLVPVSTTHTIILTHH